MQPKPTAHRATARGGVALRVHCDGRTEKQPNGIFHSLAVGDFFMDGVCVDFYSSSLTVESRRVMAVKGGWRVCGIEGRKKMEKELGKKKHKEEELRT